MKIIKILVIISLISCLFACNNDFDRQDYKEKVENMSDEKLKVEYEKFTK